MSATVAIYSFSPITEAELVRFVADVGGEIQEEDALDAHFAAGDSHVWIYYMRKELSGDSETLEQDFLDALGAPVKLALYLHFSIKPGSGILALSIARAFAQRWPAATSFVAYDVMTAADIARVLRGERWAPIVGADVELLFPAAPDPKGAIEGLGGLVVDQSDRGLIASAEKEVRVLNGASYDPARERIVGFIPAGEIYAWILERTAALDMHPYFLSLAANRLGAVPMSVLRIVLGYGASRAAERAAFVFCERMLQSQLGVVFGAFDLILDAEGVGEMLDSGRGDLIG
jgi:hypothetical protein